MNDTAGAFFRRLDLTAGDSSGGVLAGLTFAAKDLFDVKGYVTGAGNPDWLTTHGPAAETAFAVQVLLEAGARLVGKTVSDELAFSLSGKNIHYGTPVNPAAPDRIPGGSSSGSASAVAGGLVDFALGTDTSGSVRIPAGYCGLLGMRPTHGRISVRGVVPLAPSFDTVGWLARDAKVLWRVGKVLLAEPAAPDLPKRLLIAEDAFALADPPLQPMLQTGLSTLRNHFTAVAEVLLDQAPLAAWAGVEQVLKDYEVWQTHGSWIQQVNPCLAPDVQSRFQRASKVTAIQQAEAVPKRAAIRSRLIELLRDDGVLCLPTAPSVAPLEVTPEEALDEVRRRTLALTCLAGLGGLPQLTIPMVSFNGCPAGISLMAAPGRDTALLALATLLEL